MTTAAVGAAVAAVVAAVDVALALAKMVAVVLQTMAMHVKASLRPDGVVVLGSCCCGGVEKAQPA